MIDDIGITRRGFVAGAAALVAGGAVAQPTAVVGLAVDAAAVVAPSPIQGAAFGVTSQAEAFRIGMWLIHDGVMQMASRRATVESFEALDLFERRKESAS